MSNEAVVVLVSFERFSKTFVKMRTPFKGPRRTGGSPTGDSCLKELPGSVKASREGTETPVKIHAETESNPKRGHSEYGNTTTSEMTLPVESAVSLTNSKVGVHSDPPSENAAVSKDAAVSSKTTRQKTGGKGNSHDKNNGRLTAAEKKEKKALQKEKKALEAAAPTSEPLDRARRESGIDGGLAQLKDCAQLASTPVVPTIVADVGISAAPGSGPPGGAEKPPPKIVKQFFVRNQDDLLPYYNGDIVIFQQPEEERIVESGVLMRCQTFGIGWVNVHEDDAKNTKEVYTRPSTSWLLMPACGARGIVGDIITPEMRYLVFYPLFDFLRSRLPTVSLNDSIAKAAMALASKNFQLGDYITSTVQAFIHQKSVDGHVLGNQMFRQVITQNGGEVGFDDFGQTTQVMHGNPIVRWGQLVGTNPIDRAVPWEDVRTDVIVSKIRGNVEWDGDRPKFPERECKPGLPINWFFRFCHIDPESNFSVLANSNTNYNGALSRLLQCRPDEHCFRENAITTGFWLFKTMSARHPLQADFFAEVFKLCIGTRKVEHRLEAPAVEDVYKVRLINDRAIHDFARFIEDSNPSALQQVVDSAHTSMNWAYQSLYQECVHFVGASVYRKAYALLPHIKQKARLRFVDGEEIHVDNIPTTSSAKALLKREMAKFGKQGRLYVTLASGCIDSPHSPEYAKKAMDGLHTFVRGDYVLQIFICGVMRPTTLNDVFNSIFLLSTTPNMVFVVIFSDDSVYAININGCIYILNVDVKSNDSSQDVPAFLALSMIMGHYGEDATLALLQQSRLPITCQSPCGDFGFELAFKGIMEQSGNSMTSALNHTGSTGIAIHAFHQIVDHLEDSSVFEKNYIPSGEEIVNAIQRGAKEMGHVVTFDDTDGVMERVQFLKRSPLRTEASSPFGVGYVSIMNIGCILRSLGGIHGDMDAAMLGVPVGVFRNMSWNERMNWHVGGVIEGLKHEPSSPILDALRKRFPPRGSTVVSESVFHREIGSEWYDLLGPTSIDASAIDAGYEFMERRYGLTTADLNPLITAIHTLRLGDWVSTYAFSRIMEVDYGVPLG